MKSSLTVRTVTTKEEWSKLRASWNELLQRSSSPTVFLSYEWLTTWWDTVAGPNTSLYILVIERDGVIVALAPLMKERRRFLGIPFTTIRFISMMREASHPSTVSACLDFIVPAGGEECVSAIFEHLAMAKETWEWIQLHPIPDSSPTLRRAEVFAAYPGLTHVTRFASRCWILHLEDSWHELTSHHKRQWKKIMRRAGKSEGGWNEIQVAEYPSLEDVPGGYDTLLDIERRSWKWDKGVSLNAFIYKDFYRQLAHRLSGTGMLSVGLLTADGQPIAYDYQVRFGDVIWALKTSCDETRRKHSPGKILMYNLVQIAHDKGVKAIDYLWGEDDLKVKMANRQQEYRELLVFSDSLRGRLLRFFFRSHSRHRGINNLSGLVRRAARKLGIRLATSELTREDQLQQKGLRNGGHRQGDPMQKTTGGARLPEEEVDA